MVLWLQYRRCQNRQPPPQTTSTRARHAIGSIRLHLLCNNIFETPLIIPAAVGATSALEIQQP